MKNYQGELKKIILRSSISIATLLLVLCSSTRAKIISVTTAPWSATSASIIKNGTALPQPIFDQPSHTKYNGIDYQYVQDNQQPNLAIAHSGNGSGSSQIFQHVFGYSIPGSGINYQVSNTIIQTRELLLSAQQASTKANRNIKNGTKLHLRSKVLLNGSMLLAKNPGAEGWAGLDALFKVELKQEIQKKSKTVQKTVFSGFVRLSGTKNGKVKIKTSGNINKKYIKIAHTTDRNIYRIDFDNAEVPYTYNAKVGEVFKIDSFVTGTILSTDGAGAEIGFGPNGINLPAFSENGIPAVPEPATILLLSGGFLCLLRKRKIQIYLPKRRS